MEIAAKTLHHKIYTKEQHKLDAKKFDRRALRISNRLIETGFEAYLVGGCLRDSLISQTPKDFDIVTNARPEQVAELFRNCRIIGRRFRLAHVYFGREIIEVATFRAPADEQNKTNATGHVIEDNHYGSIEDDVIRRDFTINALYYNPHNETLIDYLDSMDDIQSGVIRLIGDPVTRYTEDPVRMLRAARFAAKLNMTLADETLSAIDACREGLKFIPPARLFDEAQKLFMSGFGVKSYEVLCQLDLLGTLLPDVARVLLHQNKTFSDYTDAVIRIALANTDKRIAQGKPVTIAFLLAAFLWPVYQLQYRGLLKERDNWHSAMHEAVDLVLIAASEQISIPVRLRSMIREIWTLQARFDLIGNSTKKTQNLLNHPRFRAAYDFLLIREAAGEPVTDAVKWWRTAQTVPSTFFDSPVRRKQATKSRRRTRK